MGLLGLLGLLTIQYAGVLRRTGVLSRNNMNTPSPVRIVLSLEAERLALAVAVRRHESSVKKGLAGKYGGATDGPLSLRLHEMGACAECAVATFLDEPLPDHVDVWSVADIGEDIAVRGRSEWGYDLIKRPHEPVQWRYVLVTVSRSRASGRPVGWIRGWMHGSDMERPEWLRRYGGRPAAYFVPARYLTDPQALRGAPSV